MSRAGNATHALTRRGGALIDAAEARLRRLARAAARPRAHVLLVAALVLMGLAARLPFVFEADDVVSGHGDSYIFFNQVQANYLAGDIYPDPHRGSGWNLLLYATFLLFDVEPGTWAAYRAPLEGEAARAALIAHSLSAVLAAGVVAAAYLLAREVLPLNASLVVAALVALDPYHLSITTSAMSEPLYIVLFTLALVTVLRARRHGAWLLATGALMALAHMLRINGIVMFLMTLCFAAILLPRTAPRLRWRWLGAAVLVFVLVSSPYLAWRAHHLPGALDYGTNQRFWADELWDLHDGYWSSYTVKEGGPRETMGDYFARHGLAEAVGRMWMSLQWQVFDLFGVGKWPPLEKEGGQWVGTRPDGAALTPLVVALSFVAAFTALHRRELWFVPVALAFTLATFVWVYPLVRSVRYFSPLIPLFVVFALVGWSHLATLVKRPYLVGALVFGSYLTLYGARLMLLHVPSGLARTMGHADVRVLASVGALAWLCLALAPHVAIWRPRRALDDAGAADAGAR